MDKEKPLGIRIGESVFCAGYLAFALIAGLIFLRAGGREGDTSAFATTCAAMTLLLGCGDAFHLVPRITINVKGVTQDKTALKQRAFWLGLGNLVSSVTMTVFYCLLFQAMTQEHGMPSGAAAGLWGPTRVVLYLLAAVRIALCLFPQNRWFDGVGSAQWGLLRNIPFVVMGLITCLYLVAWFGEGVMALLVCISFACYMGVVLLAREKPMMGMLMIPKTVCYIILIGMLLARI